MYFSLSGLWTYTTSWDTTGSALGHRQIKSTARYSHLSQHTLLAAVDASANATGIDWGPAQAVKTGDNLALAAA